MGSRLRRRAGRLWHLVSPVPTLSHPIPCRPINTKLLTHPTGVGSFLCVLLCNSTLDRIYTHLALASPASKGKPEFRLPLCILGALGLPIAITAFGWIAELRLPAPLLLACVALQGFTLLLTIIPLSAYVVDAYGIYSASAMTGLIVTRCLAGTFLPLGVGPLVERVGYGWAFTGLGVVSLGLAGVPVMVMWWGEGWRQRSVYTQDA
jgi:hypothetical protein